MLEFIATNGEQVVPWVLGILAAVLTKFVWGQIGHAWTRATLQRTYDELTDAVLEVWQTYTSELKRARQDGLLTETEKLEARRRAVALAKSNLGEKGLQRLARALGVSRFFGEATDKVDRWLGSKTESVYAGLKGTGVLKNGVAHGVTAVPAKAVAGNPS